MRNQKLIEAEIEAYQLYIEMGKAKEKFYSLKALYARACRKVKEAKNQL